MPDNKTNSIKGYHAHVYYDAQTKDQAAILREAVEESFEIRMGRWHDRPVGPHPCWSYQIAFEPALFGQIIPWLALNRRGLVVFIHPETGDHITDHTDFAIWMGERMDLDLDALR